MKAVTDRIDAHAQFERPARWQALAKAWARLGRNSAIALWTWARDGYEARQRRMVADLLYTELSKLSDADLERRGMARADLYRLTQAMTER